MENPLINKLFEVLQGLKTDTTNLHKDLDEKDEREETKGDLSQIFKSFGELRSIVSKLNDSDKEKLQEELRQLMRGEESIFEYNRDVNNILLEVKKRTEQNEPTKNKVIEHLPAEQKHKDVESLFDNWRSILSNVQQLLEQNSKAGSR